MQLNALYLESNEAVKPIKPQNINRYEKGQSHKHFILS